MTHRPDRRTRKAPSPPQPATVLHFASEPPKPQRLRWAVSLLVGLGASIAFASVLDGMLELGFTPQVLGVAIAVALAEALLALKPAIARGANIAAAITAVVACVMRVGPLYDGFPLLCNRAFELSAERQAYVYQMFEVGLETEAAQTAMIATACFMVAIIAASTCFALFRGRAVAALVVAAALGAAQAYFGVNAPAFANAAMAAACAICLALCLRDRRTRPTGTTTAAAGWRILFALACASAIAITCWIAYPTVLHGDNPTVHAVNEQLRDSVAGGEDIASAFQGAVGDFLDRMQENQGGAVSVEAQGSSESEQADAAEHAAPESLTAGSGIDPLAMALIMVALVAFALAVAWFVQRQRVRRKLFDANRRIAIDARFRHIVRRLVLLGLSAENKPCSRRAADVERIGGRKLACRYAEAMRLWQRSEYSTLPLGDDDVSKMGECMQEIIAIIADDQGATSRMKQLLLCYYRN